MRPSRGRLLDSGDEQEQRGQAPARRRAGRELRAEVLFAREVEWRPWDAVTLVPTERYRVLERRDGDPVVLVVEPAGLPTPAGL